MKRFKSPRRDHLPAAQSRAARLFMPAICQVDGAFGTGFFVFARIVVGPLAGFMPPIWQVARNEPALTLALSVSQHLLFGVCSTLFARFCR